MDTNLVHSSQQITDYFTDDDFTSHEYSNHIIHLFNFDTHTTTYPDITDTINNEIVATHTNGVESSFITTGDEVDISSTQTSTETSTETSAEGFTLSGSNDYYNGNWIKTGLVDRVGNGFLSSTDVGIYRHNYGSDAYVLYNYREGNPQSPVWVLTRYGNNEGPNSITPDHDHLNAVGFHGTLIQLVTGESQTFNGIKYPPSELLGGTMTITGSELESTGTELESTGANVGATNYQIENTKNTQGYISYENKNLAGSHKKIGTEILSDLRLKLLDSGGESKSCVNNSIFYELEIKYDETF